MIGCLPNGYEIWYSKDTKVFTSKDVKFHEHRFPYKENSVETKNSRTRRGYCIVADVSDQYKLCADSYLGISIHKRDY